MKNKKGFTLVELMAVIVILAIIIAIAVPAYGAIKTNIDKNNYKNKIELIETAASKYAEDTHYEAIFVEDLIKAGYLDPDDKNGDILNNITKEKINCYIVQVRNESGMYYANFINKDYTSDDGKTCNINAINDYNQTLKIVMYESENKEIEKELKYNEETKWWTRKDVLLKAEVEAGKEIDSMSWYKGYAQQPISSEGETYLVHTTSVLQENYTVVAKLDDGKEYRTTVRVYIDKIVPKFYQNDGNELDDEWLTEITYNVKAYDNESGIYGYCIKKDGIECNKKDDYKKKLAKITDNGTYEIYIMDNVGNTNNKEEEIKKIDNVTMKCNISIESGTTGNAVNGIQWYKGNSIKLKVTPEQVGPSGVSLGINSSNKPIYSINFSETDANPHYSKDISDNVDGTTYYGFIKNQVANANCPIKVHFEKTITAATMTSNSLKSTYDTITVSYTSGSAISKIASETCYLYDSTSGAEVKSVTANGSKCTFGGLANKTSDKTYYVKIKSVSKAGNEVWSSQSSNITIPGYCTSGNVNYRDGSICTNVCGGGTYNQIAYSKMDNTTLCPDRNLNSGGSACGGVKYGDGSTCTNACGGTLNRVAYSSLDGSRCSDYDKPSGGTACGGVETTPKYGSYGSCSATCGGGTKTRTVSYYSNDGTKICSTSTDSATCNTQSCCINLLGNSNKKVENSGVMCNDASKSWAINPTSVDIKKNVNLKNYKTIKYKFSTSRTSDSVQPRCYLDFTSGYTTAALFSFGGDRVYTNEDDTVTLSSWNSTLANSTGDFVLRVTGTAETSTYCMGQKVTCTLKTLEACP